MSKVINMLTNVQTAEVSLVRRGANNKRFALTKEDRSMKFAALLTTVLATEAEGESKLVETLKAAGKDEEAIEVAVANFRIQTGFKDKLSKEELATVTKAAGLEVVVAKADDDEEDPEKPGFFKNGKKMPFKKTTPVDMPVEMQKTFDDQAAEMAVIKKENADNKAELVALQKESKRKEYVAKCATEFSHVPGMSSDEMGDMLQEAYEVSDNFGKRLEKQWGETSNAIKKSALLSSQGVAHSTHDGSSAWGKMETLAKEYVAKDATLTVDSAMGKVMSEHPELYQEYLAENPAQGSR